ncbi:MAG: motA [Actinomycetia bacterium]|nr:motA [Actinomycetes bacterium]
MDPASIIGLVLGLGAVFGSMIMEGGNPASIFLPPALVLVFLGTFGAVMIGGTLKDALGFFGSVAKAFMAKVTSPAALIEATVSLAERARREGLLALEDAIKAVENPFLRKGLEMAVDGTDPEEVREILEAEVEAKKAAVKTAAKPFTDMGGYAPTIGIIGTVIGLIHVLENLSDPGKLGHLIAGAFVATLWGVMSANVLWLPLGSRIKRIGELEIHQMELVIEGVMAIQAGANPRLIAQKLRSLCPPGSVPEAEAA